MTSKNETPAEPLIARDATYYRAPEALRKRIHATLVAEAREQSRSTWLQWGGMAAAFALVSVISWNAAMMYATGTSEERLEGDIMTAHVRSLMADSHLNDVVSTDQHTVKPWFTGKLDFAPTVTDLAASGFTLTGGRLDYLNGRPVAALTYRHRLHVINLFEWPTPAGRDTAPETVAQKGYSMVHWRRAGIEYWAISDVASADLLALADLLSKS